MTSIKQLAVIVALAAYAAFATYQWISASSKTAELIEAAVNAERLKSQEAAVEQAAKAKTEAEAKAGEVKIVYKTIKDVVYKNRVIDSCNGHFSDELRLGLSKATAGANAAMPAGPH